MVNYNTDDLFQFKGRSTMSKPSFAPYNTAGRHRSDVENMAEERQRNGRTTNEPPQAVDPEHQEPSSRRKPALVRSKTFDNSLLTQVQADSDSKIERKKSHYSQLSKSNCQYHKIFKEISKEEQLRQSYTCALQKDILYQGRMFVSDHWICFHSKVFGKDTKIAIPVISVTHIKKTKTAILVPNALVISTANDRYVFVSFLSRDNTYKFLMSVCLHLEEKSPCSSPIPSSAENSFRSTRSPRSPRFPLSFSGDFSDLDGAVRQRRQEMEESSSSDSQTPDYEKIAEFPVPPFLDVLKHTDGATPPEHPDHQHKVKNQHQNQQSPDNKQHDKHHSVSEVVIDSRTMKPVSLNTVLFVYLFLVCVLVLSSCYLAFKIVSLEQRLTTLGSVTDFTNHENDFLRVNSDVNTELFSELLTINLIKLEKVQKNLQRLLDEAA
ncbi:GRAM domain-containing protein 2B isoform X2 [Thunnus albacares]|uniref:GRAM domain-containing protein 2B isoform X2 n=2 Tax=Thunnus maccoyii TaxID=8240 RepID=UPI001C4D7169|nr:GRAM domain-containing protein 2B isoform X2 [Thunnus maccoyii]XP_044189366.1 GRAM domain-containing protein 2B isoform X2 [Thunnus albacares]